jgi:hypothetical protein
MQFAGDGGIGSYKLPLDGMSDNFFVFFGVGLGVVFSCYRYGV